MGHCKVKCGPQYLPERHLPQKGAAKLEWDALLAPAAELVEALGLAEEEEQQQLQPEQQQQTALLCNEALEREEEGQQGARAAVRRAMVEAEGAMAREGG